MIFFNNPKFKTVCRDEKSFLIHKTKHNSLINEDYIKFIIENTDSGFLPVSWTKNKSGEHLNYNISSLVVLSDYLRSEITSEKYFFIVSKLIRLIEICHLADLPSDNILLKPSAVFYDPLIQKISIVILPIDNIKIKTDVLKFFKEINTKATIKSDNRIKLNKYKEIINDCMLMCKKNDKSEALSFFLRQYKEYIEEKSEQTNSDRISMKIPATELLSSVTSTVSGTSCIYNGSDSEHTVLLAQNAHLPYLTDENENKTELTVFPFSIGRSRKNNLQLEISTVSGTHANITCDNDTYYINDLGSANGTFLNSTSESGRIHKSRLNDGDHIYIYHTKLVFHCNEVSSTVICGNNCDKDSPQLYSAYTTKKYIAYIIINSTQEISSIYSFPFKHQDISGIVFISDCIDGRKRYLIRNISCNDIKIEGVLLDTETETEIFSGCSFSVADNIFSFFIEE